MQACCGHIVQRDVKLLPSGGAPFFFEENLDAIHSDAMRGHATGARLRPFPKNKSHPTAESSAWTCNCGTYRAREEKLSHARCPSP